jgi:ABC-type phosphate transport system substrate-binding protein
MKSLQTILTIGALCLCAAANASAGEIKIIANSSVLASDVSADDLKRVFLATKSSLSDGSHVEPIVQKAGPTHEAFLKEYLGKTDSALGIYYRSLVFTGKGAIPKTLSSDNEVAAYVAKTKGAIGYVSASTAAPGAKTIEVK